MHAKNALMVLLSNQICDLLNGCAGDIEDKNGFNRAPTRIWLWFPRWIRFKSTLLHYVVSADNTLATIGKQSSWKHLGYVGDGAIVEEIWSTAPVLCTRQNILHYGRDEGSSTTCVQNGLGSRFIQELHTSQVQWNNNRKVFFVCNKEGHWREAKRNASHFLNRMTAIIRWGILILNMTWE